MRGHSEISGDLWKVGNILVSEEYDWGFPYFSK